MPFPLFVSFAYRKNNVAPVLPVPLFRLSFSLQMDVSITLCEPCCCSVCVSAWRWCKRKLLFFSIFLLLSPRSSPVIHWRCIEHIALRVKVRGVQSVSSALIENRGNDGACHPPTILSVSAAATHLVRRRNPCKKKGKLFPVWDRVARAASLAAPTWHIAVYVLTARLFSLSLLSCQYWLIHNFCSLFSLAMLFEGRESAEFAQRTAPVRERIDHHHRRHAIPHTHKTQTDCVFSIRPLIPSFSLVLPLLCHAAVFNHTEGESEVLGQQFQWWREWVSWEETRAAALAWH